MSNNEEKLRLLFIEQEEYDNGRAAKVSQGAATILGRLPSYIAPAIWCIVFVISFTTLLMLLIFIALVNEGKIVEQKMIFPKGGAFILTEEIQSEFCSQMIAKHHEKRQEIPDRDLKLFDSGNNVFYMVMQPLDKYSACSVESVLLHSPDKNIFMMFLNDVSKTEFENVLKVKYSNFNLLKVNGKKILRGSPFEGRWKGDERSLYEVALLTVWQFGGTVLSEYMLMLNNKVFNSKNLDCKVDPDLIFCPMQCAAYLYELIGVTLRSERGTGMDALLDGSLKEFCGSEHLMRTGCAGVRRILEGGEVCEEPSDEGCSLVRTKDWLKLSSSPSGLWEEMKGHCPATRAHLVSLERMKDLKSTTTSAAPPYTNSTLSYTKLKSSILTDIVMGSSLKRLLTKTANWEIVLYFTKISFHISPPDRGTEDGRSLFNDLEPFP